MHFLRRFLILLFNVAIIENAFAQFNDSIYHYLHYAATGVINKTNTSNSFLLSNGFRFQVKKKRVSLNNNNSFVYGEQQKRITNRDLTSSLDFNYQPGKQRFYYWGLINYDKSYSLKVNNRLQTGVGVAYSIIDKPASFINISDGILYEKANLKLTDITRDVYETFRNSFRLRYKFTIKEIIVINGTNFYQPSLNDGNDYVIQLANNLSIKLNKWLSFTTAATYNKVQRTHRENLLVTFGISAEKYF
ncbi:MAG: DUF481 domain-containing protein [Bacteroidota bacterium]